MTTFNNQGLKLAAEIKINPEYNHIKKDVLIQFGFDPINIRDFVEWVSFCYMEEFEEITGNRVQNERRYTPEMVDLLTETEREEIGETLEKANHNQIEGSITADGQTTLARYEIENKRRKERFAIVNKKEWFEIGQALKEKRLELEISLTKMGRILKTSTSRISNLENGKGVMMADHLIASYKIALELERIQRQEKEIKVSEVKHKNIENSHIEIIGYDGKLYNIIIPSESIFQMTVTQIYNGNSN